MEANLLIQLVSVIVYDKLSFSQLQSLIAYHSNLILFYEHFLRAMFDCIDKLLTSIVILKCVEVTL